MQAARIVLDRLAPARRGRPVQFALPAGTDAGGLSAAFDAILKAMANGELTTEEGASVASVLEIKRKVIETHELAERIAAVERSMPT